jgi:RNA polymerase sigma-70 factor (ECF subfamily)
MEAAFEHELVLRARNGERGAFRLLVERHMKEAYNLAHGFVNDHDIAEDVVQDAFVRAFQSLDTFRGEARFGTWLYRIVVNLSLNRAKQERRRAERHVSLPVLTGFPLDDGGISFDDSRSEIERALHELPTLQRAVLILRHLEGLSTRQVSEILHCSEGTVKTHLFRGMKKMKRKLQHLKDEVQ